MFHILYKEWIIVNINQVPLKYYWERYDQGYENSEGMLYSEIFSVSSPMYIWEPHIDDLTEKCI